jgi:hypothetical protein
MNETTQISSSVDETDEWRQPVVSRSVVVVGRQVVGASVGRWARGDLNPHVLADTGT